MKMQRFLLGAVFLLGLLLLGFVLGAYVGSFFIPDDAGLAGGAMVLGYGLGGSLVGIVLALVLLNQLSHRQFINVLRVVVVLSLLAGGFLLYRYFSLQSPSSSQQRKPARPLLIQHMARPEMEVDPDNQALGLGIAKPNLFEARTLFFYQSPRPERRPADTPAQDSLTFRRGDHFTDITYAPPWFVPEYTKLDYDMLLLRVVTLTPDWLEVVANRMTGQTVWIDRYAVDWQSWPEFLLSVHAVVELPNPADNPPRIKPLSHASPLTDPPAEPWKATAIQGDWLQVNGQGWLRWHDGERLLLRYVMLS